MTDLLNLLAKHQGRDSGIGVQTLAARLGTTPREARKLVSRARAELGVAICAHPATGYYIAVTAQELEASCQFLEARALHSLRLLSRMRRVALPTLLGQLMLNQA